VSRSALLLLLLAWLVALPASAQGRSSRERVSANGVYSVRLVEKAPGQCTLEVSKDSGPVWALPRCVGKVDDLYFVSDDGRRVWVFEPLAKKGQRRPPGKKHRKVPAWANTVVATLYDGQAGKVRELRLMEIVPGDMLTEVRQMTGHLKWLEGLLGVPGKGPRLTDAGRVEFETVGGKSHQLTF
jgi:hypothetical protein